MKKMILLVLTLITLFSFTKIKEDELIIPSEAIRLRVIANSNTVEDQNIKIKVRDAVQKEILTLSDTKSLSKTRNNIKKEISNIDDIVKDTLKEINVDQKYDVNYGYNYFPKKKYKGVTYKEGNYESLVITLGEGKGDNFWCVLFPPLCLLDAKDSNTDKVEYKLYIKEIIDKYL